ncbi:coenzyme F420-0:L-glutamate ligase [Methanocaldococcus indicus]|uniref:coenzyme F420-0:L-glutamate ligase n=1 Tax=Methanocaldococcus indicus TaxID=213231 RepID=UPI003C6D888F
MRAYPIKTRYIKKGENPIPTILGAIKNSNIKLEDGDFIVLSEKMIATAEGRFIDESQYNPSILAYFCYYWSKYLWGYLLGKILGLKEEKIKNLRNLPKNETLNHKEAIIKEVGLLYALKPYAEGGVDLTNVPGTYACLLPKNPKYWAKKLKEEIKKEFNIDVNVMVADTDATYRIFNIYITALPYAIKEIKSGLGVIYFILGKLAERLKIGGFVGCTPLAVVGDKLDTYTLVRIAFISDRVHKTIKNMEELYKKFGTYIITEEHLEKLEHTPVVIVKMKEKFNIQKIKK